MSKVTTIYKDGGTITYEWCPILDGEWPYPKNCEEVIFKLNINDNKYES